MCIVSFNKVYEGGPRVFSSAVVSRHVHRLAFSDVQILDGIPFHTNVVRSFLALRRLHPYRRRFRDRELPFICQAVFFFLLLIDFALAAHIVFIARQRYARQDVGIERRDLLVNVAQGPRRQTGEGELARGDLRRNIVESQLEQIARDRVAWSDGESLRERSTVNIFAASLFWIPGKGRTS